MLENSFGITFFLKSSTKGTKERYVYLRITVDGNSVTFFLNGPDRGKAAAYATNNGVFGLEASASMEIAFLYSDIPISEFDRRTLIGYAEGVQFGMGNAGANKFESYEGEWIGGDGCAGENTSGLFKKGRLLYHGYAFNLGIGPENFSPVSGSKYQGCSTYQGIVPDNCQPEEDPCDEN